MDFAVPGKPSVSAVVPASSSSAHAAHPSTSMSYHEQGQRLYVSAEGGTKLQVLDCVNTGKATHPALRCEREPIHCVQSTHHEHCVLVSHSGGGGSNSNGIMSSSSSASSPTQKYAISYWSLHDNKWLRHFRGHTDLVTQLSLSPADDTFLSSSRDRTVRLWTAQSAGCLGELKVPGAGGGGSDWNSNSAYSDVPVSPLAAFDSTGLVFAVTAPMAANSTAATAAGGGGGGQHLHLYDARNYTGGAFTEWQVTWATLEQCMPQHVHVTPEQAAQLARAPWTSLQFNVSGNQILVGTAAGLCLVLDGFEGTIQRIFSSTSQRPAVVCFTSDDKTVLVGNDNGTVTAWSLETGGLLQTLNSGGNSGSSTADAIQCMAANPKYAQFASSGQYTALWNW